MASGGAVDTLGRLIGARIHALTGRSVVVEPRPGAGGDLAMASERVKESSFRLNAC